MALIVKPIIQFIALWELIHCVSSELYRVYSLIDGEIVLLVCPMTNSSKTEWVKDYAEGPLVATYDNTKGTVTYGTQWAGDVNITNDGRRYHMSLRVHYRRDRGAMHCFGVDGAKLDRLARYDLNIHKTPVIHYLIKDTVQVLSDTLLLTENEKVKLVLVVAYVREPYYVNWMVGDEDVTEVGTNSESLSLQLLVTKDMHERNLKVIIRDAGGTDTIYKRIHVAAAPFFVHTPQEQTLIPRVMNVLNITFYSIPRFTKYLWFRDNVTYPTTAVTSYVLDVNVTIPLFGKFIEVGGYKAVLVLWGGEGVYTLTVENGYGLIGTSVDMRYPVDDGGGGDGGTGDGGSGGCERCCATCGGTRDGIGGAGCNRTVAEESSVCVTWQPIPMIVVGVIGGLFLITVIALVVVLVRANRCNNENAVVNENRSHGTASTAYRGNTPSGYHSNAPSGSHSNMSSGSHSNTPSGYQSNAPSGYHRNTSSDMSPSGKSADYITPISDPGYLEMRDIHGNSDQSLQEPVVSHGITEPRMGESVGEDPAYHYLP